MRPGSCLLIGSNEHSGDKPLCEALQLMNDEGITSLAVIDNQYNVIGNISTVDVKVTGYKTLRTNTTLQ